jgi:hypothetical protein
LNLFTKFNFIDDLKLVSLILNYFVQWVAIFPTN